MENDTAAELVRLDRVERHLRRLDALTEGAKRDLALARKLVQKRADQRLDSMTPEMRTVSRTKGTGSMRVVQTESS